MLKKYLFSILLSVVSFSLSAQYSPLNTMPWNNNSLYNPAATAINYKHQFVIGSTFDNNEIFGSHMASSSYALYNYRWDKINSGLGINYKLYNSDFRTRNHIMFNYAYEFHLKVNQILSFGISYGYDQYTIHFSKMDFWGIEPIAPFPSEDQTYYASDVSLGAMYKSKKLLIGFSVNSRFDKDTDWNTDLTSTMNIAYDFSLGKNVILTPGIYAYTLSGSLKYLDISVKSTFMNRYWIGVVISPANAYNSIGAFAGIDIKKKYRIGYSYRRFSLPATYNVNELVFSLMIK